jgi:hypothetical protein
MKEGTETAGSDGYTFTRPEGLLAHYTKASTAFEHILPGKLRLSPYRLMRDPAENKDILPSITSRGDPPSADRAIAEVYALIKAARDRMRVLSLTRDAEDRGGEFRTFDCCWSRPRMWEQYGDDHRGACLLFDRARLERAIHEQWPDERTRQLGNVEYRRDGSAEVYNATVVAPRILEDEDPSWAVGEYINVKCRVAPAAQLRRWPAQARGRRPARTPTRRRNHNRRAGRQRLQGARHRRARTASRSDAAQPGPAGVGAARRLALAAAPSQQPPPPNLQAEQTGPACE